MTTPAPTSPESVLVLGGAGGLGAWLVEHLFDGAATVAVADVVGLETVPPGVEAHRLEYRRDVVAGLPDMARFDVVVVAVPIPHIEEVTRRILPFVRPGALVLDVASTKEAPMAAIEAGLPAGVDFVGTHPLLGPAVPSLVGQTVVVCPSARTALDDVAWLPALLAARGATVRRMDPREHDRAMAVIQVLTHFVALTVAATLEDERADLRQALDLLTPPFRALAGLVGRIVDNVPLAPPEGPGGRLYADIQVGNAPHAQRIRDGFERAVGRLNGLARQHDDAGLAREIERVAAYFPDELLASCRQLFAQSHATAQTEALALHARRAAGALCAFRSTATGRIVAGRVRGFSATSVTVEVCSALRIEDGEPVYGLGYDEPSRAAAARLGFAIPPGREATLARGEHELLADAELERWRRTALVPHRRDLTLAIPAGMDGAAVCALLPRLAEGVLATEIAGRYEPPDGSPPRWTVRLELRGDLPPAAVLDALRAALRALAIVAP